MAKTLTFTHPTGTPSVVVNCESVTMEQEAGDPSSLVIIFSNDFDVFDSESDTDNPVQLNSAVELKNGATTLWYGSVFSRELVQSEGEQVIRVSCLDPLWKLKSCIAKLDGTSLFSKTSPPLIITNEKLYPLEATGKDFYPVSTSDAWLPEGKEATTTLGETILAGATMIKAATTFEGFVPTGFIKIESEWIYYDGYNQDGTDWYFYNCKRGVLGTSAAAHLATETITQRTSQKIHPAVGVTVQRYNTDTSVWDNVSVDDFFVQTEDGFFSFAYDPLTDPYDDPSDTIRASYAVFDEDDANTVILSDIINDWLTAAANIGGPGLAAGSIDISIDEIRLTRARVDAPLSVYAAIESILEQVGLRSGSDTDAIGFYYDHANKKVCVKNIVQGASSHTFENALHIDSDYCIDDVFSAIEATYSDIRLQQLCSSKCVWHYTNGDTPGGVTDTTLVYMDAEGNLLDGWEEDDVTTSHQYKTYKLFDGMKSTGIGLMFDSSPCAAGEIILFYFWFGDPATPATKTVDKIQAVLDARRISKAAAPFGVEIVGFRTVDLSPTPAAHPAVVEVRLGGSARVDLTAGDTAGYNNVNIEIDQIGEELQSIGVKYSGMSWNGAGSIPYAFLKEIRAFGRDKESLFVQITDDTALSGGVDARYYLYAPTSYDKLVDATFGQHKSKPVDFGASSRQGAISLARLTLLNSLVLFNTHEYVIPSISYVPAIGDTVTMPDGYVGVVLGKAIELVEGREKLQLRLLDFDANLI